MDLRLAEFGFRGVLIRTLRTVAFLAGFLNNILDRRKPFLLIPGLNIVLVR